MTHPMSEHQQIFSGESKGRELRGVLRAMFHGMAHSRYIAYRLVVKDVKADYSKSFLGMVWDLVDPLVLATIFYFLHRMRAFTAEYGMQPSLFIIYGILLYDTFMMSLTRMMDIFTRSKMMLTQMQLPPEALILSVFFRTMFDSLFRIVVMLFFTLVITYTTEDLSFSIMGFAKFLLLYPAIILCGMSIGTFLAPFSVIYGDVGKGVRIALNPLRYLSPVIWPVKFWLYKFSPVAFMLHDLRKLAVYNTMDFPWVFAAQCGFFAVLFFVGWFVFHVSIPVLAERA